MSLDSMDRFENRSHWPFADRRGPRPTPPPVELGPVLAVAALFLFAWIVLVAPGVGKGPRPHPPRTGGGCPKGCVSEKNGCSIKGNVSKSGERIYHLPGQRFYDETVITPEKGERWFCSEEEAEENGWRKAKV